MLFLACNILKRLVSKAIKFYNIQRVRVTLKGTGGKAEKTGVKKHGLETFSIIPKSIFQWLLISFELQNSLIRASMVV